MTGNTLTVGALIAAMDQWAPPALAFDWDRPGLAIGQPDWPVRRVLAALTVGPETAEAAALAGAEMIVSHHPLIYEPLHALRTDHPHTAMCLMLAEKKIACFSAHTNLDVAPGGVNDTLAGLLGIIERSPLMTAPQAGHAKLVTFVPESHLAAVREAVCNAGAGSIGAYTHCTFSAAGIGTFLPGEGAEPFSGSRGILNQEPERRFETLVPIARLGQVVEALRKAHPYEEPAYDVVELKFHGPHAGLGVKGRLEAPTTLRAFADHVAKVLSVSFVRVLGDMSACIERVGAMGGSGGSHVHEIPGDLDVFVSGDVNYHSAMAARLRGLALIDAGHDGTEKCIVPVIAHFLREKFPGLEVTEFEEPGLWCLAGAY
ncbi:MAG TPA: Nif3-like dinuclear metal center hexameric protein [Candidatus Bathyarchaeia archaeon]|nr:Nif3-like dinuclear metal center hexameric protein [Candidatus Bathyarchaeia archaeon]